MRLSLQHLLKLIAVPALLGLHNQLNARHLHLPCFLQDLHYIHS